LGLNFDVRKVETDILSRYPNSTELFQKLTNFSYYCQIILAKSIPDAEKLQQLEDLTNRTFGVALNVAPQPSPSPVPPPPDHKRGRPISSTEASAAATQVMRLILDSSSTADDIIKRLSVPFCAGNILPTASDVRDFVEAGKQPNVDNGRFHVRVKDTKVVGELNFGSAITALTYGVNTLDAIQQCMELIVPLDYIVVVEANMIDMNKSGSFNFIVGRESGLIKGLFVR
jgi:hypothetical protein